MGDRREDEALRASHRFLDSIVENLPHMIFVKDAEELRFVRFNRAGEELLGYPRSEMLGKNDYDFFPKEEADFFTGCDRAVLAEGSLVDIAEEPIHTKGHGLRYLHTMKIPILDEDGKPLYLLGISEDVTERKAAEEALVKATSELRERDERLRLLLHHFPGAVWSRALDGTVTALAGTRSDDLEPLVNEPAEAIRSLETEAREVGESQDELRLEDRAFELHIQRLDNGEVVGVALDVTERRRLDAERLQARLQKSQQLETLGLLAGGIAHDFNNLLASIMGAASLCLMELEQGEGVSIQRLERVISAAERAGELTRQMLAYSGRGSASVAEVDLSALVAEMVELLRASVSKKAEIVLALDPKLPPVRADASQVRQLVMNLITNASDALMGKQGTITISTRAERLVQQPTPFGTTLDGRYVRLTVTDDGCGMDPATAARVFDPFFTTKKVGGHGLGLAAALGIMKGHNGSIVFTTAPGQGTSFAAWWPTLAVASAVPVTAPADLHVVPQLKGRVLVVDDVDGVRQMVADTLALTGLTVVQASDGAEALEVYRKHRGDFDLVILDLSMPRLSGTEVFRGLAAEGCKAAVLFTSGFAEDSAIAHQAEGWNWDFLAKPYRAPALVARVKRLLELR